jgi:pimeloyl-ACP methyl ester carboxylesterase
VPTPLVLIHGGGVDSSVWSLVTARLRTSVLAVDLPGRPCRPAPKGRTGIADAAAAVMADIDAAGFDRVVLAGHSLAGSVLPAVTGLLEDRVAHVVFVACTVPAQGTTALSTLELSFFDAIRAAREANPDVGLAADLDPEQLGWYRRHVVADRSTVAKERVDLRPLHRPFPRTWIRTTRDIVVPPEKQLGFAANVGTCTVVDLDAGHTCMVTHPAELAAVLDRIAANPSAELGATA